MAWGSLVGGGLGAAAGGALGGPLGAGIGMSLGGALGGALEGAFSDDPSAQPVYVDPNDYTSPGYAEYLAGVRERQARYGERQAPTLDWSMANQDRQLALQARGYQDQAAQSYLDVLSGKAPSLAQLQMQQGLTAANAQAAQQAAMARGGPGNLLLAQQGAQRTGAANALAANAAAAQLRARELDLARQGVLAAGSQMRGQDLDMRGQSQGQVKIGADVQLAQTGLNDAMQRQLEQGRLSALGGQQAGQLAYAGAKYGSGAAAQQQNQAIAQQNAERDRQMVGGIMQTGGQLAGMGFQANEAEKNRQAYLAGKTPQPKPQPTSPTSPTSPSSTYGAGGGYGPY